MPRTTRYDVIIVGAGPAGATAAYVLSQHGLSVLLIDQSRFPRQKLCGGVLTFKTLRLLERVFDETRSSLKQQGVLNFEADHYEIFHRDRSLGERPATPPFSFVKRYHYDAFLVKKATAAGAHLIESQRVTTFDPSRTEVATAAGTIARGRFVIGADGAASTIRRSFPGKLFNQRAWRHQCATAVQVSASRADIRGHSDHPVICFGFIRWGYSWMFPNDDQVLVGTSGLNRANKSLGRAFRSFLAAMGWEQLAQSRVRAHSVPYGNFLPRPAYRNAMLVGDAAGLVHPITGEGIYYAQRSAELAAQAIIKSAAGWDDPEGLYMRGLRTNIYPELMLGKKVRPALFGCLVRLPMCLTKLLFSTFHAKAVERVHGTRT